MSAPQIIPPSIDHDAQTIEQLDFAPPCEYSGHASSNSAALIVWFMNPRACGCSGPAVVNFCAPCWDFRCDGEWMMCTRCGADLGGPWSHVLRVERIA